MPWFPGYNAQGYKVVGDPIIMAQGFQTQPPIVTSPGTVASGGTVQNTTQRDCMVYMSATGGIAGVSMNPQGTVTAGTTLVSTLIPVYVAANQSVVVNYAGTLTWHWLAV